MKLRSGRRTARYGRLGSYRSIVPALGATGYSGYDIGRRIGNRISRSFTGTQTQRNNRPTAGIGVTGQYDRKLIYRKRNMPKFKKRRWRKFINRVHAVAERELGSNTIVFNSRVVTTNSAAASQLVSHFACYGAFGGTGVNPSLNDLRYIGALNNQGNPTIADGVSVQKSTRYFFESAIMDITIQNTSYILSQALAPVYASECKVECDVYEILVRRSMLTESNGSVTNALDLNQLYAFNPADTPAVKDNNTSPTTNEIFITSRGATPFDMTYATSMFGIKVLKKTKYMLAQGETVTYQYRDPKRRSCERADLFAEGGFNKRG